MTKQENAKKGITVRTVVELVAGVVVGAGVTAGILLAQDDDFGQKEVGKVGDTVITQQDIYKELEKAYGATATDTLIANKIVELESEKEKITVKDKDIQSELDNLISQYGSQEALEQQLSTSGMTIKDLKKDISSYIETKELITPLVKVTDEDIKAHFDANKDSYAQVEQVEASHILVADKKTANKVYKEVKAGGDFAELAKKYSTDEGNKDDGGKLGYFGKDDMVAEFSDKAFSMKVDQLSNPVKTEFGYHIIKVTGKKKAQDAKLEDVKESIKETLLNEKVQAQYSIWLEDKKEEYKVKNKLQKEEVAPTAEMPQQ